MSHHMSCLNLQVTLTPKMEVILAVEYPCVFTRRRPFFDKVNYLLFPQEHPFIGYRRYVRTRIYTVVHIRQATRVC